MNKNAANERMIGSFVVVGPLVLGSALVPYLLGIAIFEALGLAAVPWTATR